MTTKTTPSLIQTPFPVKFWMGTDLPIRDDLAKDPEGYFDRNNLMGAVSPQSIMMLEKFGNLSCRFELSPIFCKSIVIHIFREKAITISIRYKGKHATIHYMWVNVGNLLFGDTEYPVDEREVQAAQSLLLEVVSPLLKDPLRDAVGMLKPMSELLESSREIDPPCRIHNFEWPIHPLITSANG